MGVAVDTVATLKGLSGADLFNGLAHIVIEKSAWYLYKVGSTDTDDNENFITPNTGIGRWVKCNAVGNKRNSVSIQQATTATTVVDFSVTEVVVLELTVSTELQLPSTIRAGHALLKVSRDTDSEQITSYDAKFLFEGSNFSFSAGARDAIFNLLLVDNKAYIASVSEFI